MKCVKCYILLTLAWIHIVNATHFEHKDNIGSLAEQIEILKTQHRVDIIELKREIEEIK